MNVYSLGLNSLVASQYSDARPDHKDRLTPCSSRYQLWQPPVCHTVVDRSSCNSSLNRSCAERVGASAAAPALSAAAIASATYPICASIMNTTELCPNPVFGPSSRNRLGTSATVTPR